MEERSGGGLGGGGKFFLAFEDDAVEESAAGGGAEHGGQDVGFGFVDLGERELESVGAAGAVPARALVVKRGDGADPWVGEARATGVGVGDAVVEDFEHESAGCFGGVAELVLKLDEDFEAIGFAVAGPVFDLAEDGMNAHGGGAEEGGVGGGFEVEEGLAAGGEEEERG